MHLGGGKYENHMGRGLFKGFQKRIESSDGEHMHLVDDIHTVFCAGRSEISLLTQITDIVNTVVRCGVNFNNVKD